MSRETDIPIFRAPEKCIRTKKQMNLFSGSESERRFVHFIQELNTSVIGTKNGNIHVTTKSIQALLDILNQLEIWVSEISPTTSVTRYGNVAFRSWLAHLEKNSNGKNLRSENFTNPVDID